MASATIAPDLERALQRYGDDLYRLALLLTPDETRATQALLAATRRLATAATSPDEPALIRALLAALPREPRRFVRRLPAWATPPAPQRALQRPLLAAIARLPRPARTLLGLTLLRGFEPQQAGVIIGADEAGVRAQLRDTLLALAPHAATTRTLDPLHESNIPEACRPTRAALALADPRLHSEPALRGHLALCSACRATEQAWQQLTGATEEALRGALREVRIPASLMARLQGAARAPGSSGLQGWLAHPLARLALVTVPVLAIIALLVWPRGGANVPSSQAGLPGTQPAELVRRAQQQLYAPIAGPGPWHGQYAIDWVFPDGSTALLHGNIWVDQASQAHRVQLAHSSGGGPYEFELTDGGRNLWYALSKSYRAVLYPFAQAGESQRIVYRATPEQRTQMLRARLESGAWGIAANYLRQAAHAELRTWGRQRDADGRLIQLISFAGVSPLALPPDAPEATTSKVSVLLAIDEASGRLREVRELLGGERGSEQTARTTWRVLLEEALEPPVSEDGSTPDQPIFDLKRAWNGTGTFDTRLPLGNVRLPLINADQIGSPAQLLLSPSGPMWAPSRLPPDTDAALLLTNSAGTGEINITQLIYFGPGRLLALAPLPPGADLSADGGELAALPSATPGSEAQIDDAVVALRALPGQGYRGRVQRPNRLAAQPPFNAQVVAQGYTRAELSAALASLGPATPGLLHEQAPWFIERQPHDAAWRTLISALASPPQPNGAQVRHFTERVFKRQSGAPDMLLDPYHRAPYGGWPAEFTQENWARGAPASPAAESVMISRGPDGALLGKQYRSAASNWDYDALAGRVTRYAQGSSAPMLGEEQLAVLRMLYCGGATLQTQADGTRAVVLTETDWRSIVLLQTGVGWRTSACQNPHYPSVLAAQSGDLTSVADLADSAPYLVDLTDPELTTVIALGADGRPTRIEVWVGQPAQGTLTESWERGAEELLEGTGIPADLFSAERPPAPLQLDYQSFNDLPAGDEVTHTANITEVLERARSPFFGFTAPTIELLEYRLGNTDPSPLRFLVFADAVFDTALQRGYAIHSIHVITTTIGREALVLYQGAAPTLRAHLRSNARWENSQATTVRVGTREVAAWQVQELASSQLWLIFELDGTLLALGNPHEALIDALAQLERLGGPPGGPGP